MTQNGDRERELGRQARMVSIVIAVAMVLWLAAQWLGPALGLPGRYAFLFDMAALAAFVWALVVTYRIWRARRDNQG
jgi:type VI protein secretion system component VasK